MTEQYTPNTESVRAGLIALARSDAARHGDVDLDVVASEVAGQFDRWLAEVEHAAAEKAWDRGCASGYREAHTNVTERNPYRKAVQS